MLYLLTLLALLTLQTPIQLQNLEDLHWYTMLYLLTLLALLTLQTPIQLQNLEDLHWYPNRA